MKIDKQFITIALVLLSIVAIVTQGIMIRDLKVSVHTQREIIDNLRTEHDHTIHHCDSLLQDAYKQLKQ